MTVEQFKNIAMLVELFNPHLSAEIIGMMFDDERYTL